MSSKLRSNTTAWYKFSTGANHGYYRKKMNPKPNGICEFLVVINARKFTPRK